MKRRRGDRAIITCTEILTYCLLGLSREMYAGRGYFVECGEKMYRFPFFILFFSSSFLENEIVTWPICILLDVLDFGNAPSVHLRRCPMKEEDNLALLLRLPRFRHSPSP